MTTRGSSPSEELRRRSSERVNRRWGGSSGGGDGEGDRALGLERKAGRARELEGEGERAAGRIRTHAKRGSLARGPRMAGGGDACGLRAAQNREEGGKGWLTGGPGRDFFFFSPFFFFGL